MRQLVASISPRKRRPPLGDRMHCHKLRRTAGIKAGGGALIHFFAAAPWHAE
jgi:hypothetical protein